jgi:hypothetical protein
MIWLVVLLVVVDRKSLKLGLIEMFFFFWWISNQYFRQASGANIKIADLDEGSQDRHVTISGTPEQIQLAEFLIHSRYFIWIE